MVIRKAKEIWASSFNELVPTVMETDEGLQEPY
jgi:hypothetical protein